MNNKNQKLFIPLLDNNKKLSKISLHFGHTPYFGLYNFKNNKFKITTNNLNHNNLEKSPVDQIIENINPTTVFAQEMGTRAINLFTKNNIELKTGPYKTVKEVIDNFNNLKNLDNSCGH